MTTKTDQDIATLLQLDSTADITAQVVQNVRTVAEARFIQAITEVMDDSQLEEITRRQEQNEPLEVTREWLFTENKDAREMYENILADYIDELNQQTDTSPINQK